MKITYMATQKKPAAKKPAAKKVTTKATTEGVTASFAASDERTIEDATLPWVQAAPVNDAGIKPFIGGDTAKGSIAPNEEYQPKQSLSLLAQGEDFTGDVDESDITFPWVQLMHATSEAVQQGDHRGGDILLDEEKIYDVSNRKDHKPVRFMVLRASKDFVENLPFESEDMPVVCSSLAEVAECGGTTNYSDWERSAKSIPYFKPRLTLVALVEVENETPYSVNVQGANFTPAMMRVSGAAYGRLGKRLVMNFRIHKRTNAFVYNLFSTTNSYDGKTWQELSARVAIESPEFVEELRGAGEVFRSMFSA